MKVHASKRMAGTTTPPRNPFNVLRSRATPTVHAKASRYDWVKRRFRTPFVPLVPIIGIAFSIWLISGLPWQTYERFGIWLLIGLVIYFGYGMRRSKLNRDG